MTKARSNAVANAAKGDLTVGTGTNLSGILPVGANGEIFVADSSTATGLRYQENFAAGKNKIINGDFTIAQRGTSVSVGASSYTYTLDRFKSFSANTATTVSQNTSAPLGFSFSCKLQRPNANTGTSSLSIVQIIETANCMALQSQPVTVSFYVKKGANYSGGNLAVQLLSGTGSDQGGDPYSFTGLATPINNASLVLTTSFVKVSYIGTIGSTVKELALALSYTPTGTAGADDAIYVTGVQLEAGSVATAFQTATGSIQGELAACQRYFIRYENGGNFASFGTGVYYSTTEAFVSVALPVSMRTVPSASWSGGATGASIYVAGTGRTSTATAYSSGKNNCIELKITTAADTIGRSGMAYVNQNATMDISAEL